MKKIKRICLSLIFISIFLTGLVELNNIFIRKSLAKPWDMGNKIGGYFNEKDDFDIFFLGTSHSYCSFNPLLIYENTGFKSYVLASQLQPFKATYYYLKEVIKKDKPKIIFVDIQALIFFIKEDDAIIHSYLDYLPMSMNKLMMILKIVPNKYKAQNLLPLIKYHSRWDELKKEDFNIKRKDYKDYLKGYVLLKNSSQAFKDNKKINAEILKHIELAMDDEYVETNLKYLNKMIHECQKNNVNLIFVKTPISDDKCFKNNINFWEKKFEELSVDFVDFNEYKSQMNLTDDDFYDFYHLNSKGAEKFNKFFINYMFKNGFYTDTSSLDKNWLNDLKTYNINK